MQNVAVCILQSDLPDPPALNTLAVFHGAPGMTLNTAFLNAIAAAAALITSILQT